MLQRDEACHPSKIINEQAGPGDIKKLQAGQVSKSWRDSANESSIGQVEMLQILQLTDEFRDRDPFEGVGTQVQVLQRGDLHQRRSNLATQVEGSDVRAVKVDGCDGGGDVIAPDPSPLAAVRASPP